ncbi:MAG TPA: enoyl-CoA hydratase-related protein [Vicinamibacterales bacterium]|nr:enoyl-CoA hydratase-related protein [Vicinamibacterales bacterium]
MLHIRTGLAAGVGIITIDRPERFNSLDVRTAQDFRRAGLALARDPDVRVVVLRGLPGMFCSGADLKFIRDGGDGDDLAYLAPDIARLATVSCGDVFKQILEYIHSTISEIRRAPKPFVAAVDGVAAAGGFGIAMACDLIVASSRASFEWAYTKTGLTGAESSTFLLPRLIGLRRAMELVLLNTRLPAARALEYGLVTAVYDVDEFDHEVAELAARLAAGPPRAFATAKELLNQSAGMDRLDAHLDRELEELVRAADGSEFANGLDAFFGKRPARFGAA